MGRSKYSGPNCLWKHHRHTQREGEMWFTSTLSTLESVKLTIKINSYTAPLNTSSEPHKPKSYPVSFTHLISLSIAPITDCNHSELLWTTPQHPNRPSCFQTSSPKELHTEKSGNSSLLTSFCFLSSQSLFHLWHLLSVFLKFKLQTWLSYTELSLLLWGHRANLLTSTQSKYFPGCFHSFLWYWWIDVTKFPSNLKSEAPAPSQSSQFPLHLFQLKCSAYSKVIGVHQAKGRDQVLHTVSVIHHHSFMP